MTLESQTGLPTEPGIYACRQWYAWRILEWRDGWWHPGGHSAWPKGAEIEAFVGPLPVIGRDFSAPSKVSAEELEDWEKTLDWPGSIELAARGLPCLDPEEYDSVPAKEFDSTDSTPPVQEYDL